MADYTLLKDADVRIQETITGEDITGASVKWMLLKLTTSFSGDLDSIVPLFSKTVGAGVTLTTPASGIFTVLVNDTDTNTLVPGNYWVLIRIVKAGLVIPVQAYLVNVSA